MIGTLVRQIWFTPSTPVYNEICETLGIGKTTFYRRINAEQPSK